MDHKKIIYFVDQFNQEKRKRRHALVKDKLAKIHDKNWTEITSILQLEPEELSWKNIADVLIEKGVNIK